MSTKILCLGGAGAQVSAVVTALSASNLYTITVLTRDPSSTTATALSSLPHVTTTSGSCYNEKDLVSSLAGQDAVFVNTNGFAIGEKAEIYWSIRIYELAAQAGVKHFVYGGLDYVSKKGNWDPKFRCGHYDAKGKFQDYLKSQSKSPMAWTIVTSGPYIEMLSEFLAPQVNEKGTYVFTAPLGEHGHVPFIHLDDIGSYVLWALTTPSRSNGLDLEVAIEPVSWPYLAATFASVTGKPAIAHDVSVAEFQDLAWKHQPEGKDTKIGRNYAPGDDTLVSSGQNFSGWWECFRATGSEGGLLTRDYRLLDEILPGRVRSVEEWMRKVGYTGERKPVLKDVRDARAKLGAAARADPSVVGL